MTEPFTTNDQLLVTPEEAARRLSVGRTTIYELMSSGELQSVNIGRSRRVPVSSLSSFVSRLIGDVAVEPNVDAEGSRDRHARCVIALLEKRGAALGELCLRPDVEQVGREHHHRGGDRLGILLAPGRTDSHFDSFCVVAGKQAVEERSRLRCHRR